MAAIQKIRGLGVLLICVVGLALFAFIAEELVRAISTTKNIDRQTVGEVYGTRINNQEFYALYADYENAAKMSNGGQNLSEYEVIRLHDQAWNDLVTQKLIEHEAKALGLQVTDEEVQNLINTGASPVLAQTPFVNQQTGSFDASIVKQFISNYDQVMATPDYPEAQKESFEQLMKYWRFIEKQVRQTALMQKYQALLTGCLLSNPVSAQAAIDARSNISTIQIAALPYSTIKDTDVTPTEAELKAKFEEMAKQYPDMFTMAQETRDIKYITVPVEASQADEQALAQELTDYGKAMDEGSATVSAIVRESRSSFTYNALPISKQVLPSDVANIIDSLEVGATAGPYNNASDHTLNLVRLIAKTQLPDSVLYRRIEVPGNDEAASQTADSILTALNEGAPVDTIAKAYNQDAAEQWVTSAQTDLAQHTDESRAFVNTLLTTPEGAFARIDVTGGSLIIQVKERRNIIDKYDVAVIKRPIEFSDETHAAIWNKFSSFLASNTTQEDIEANAEKNGYTVRETQYLSNANHYIANTPSTTDALRWTFETAKKGDISELYECGTNNNQLLVVMLTDVHKKGKRTLAEPALRALVEQEAIKDKKAALLLDKAQGIQTVEGLAKLQGAVQDTIANITFTSPVFVVKTASSEPALSGAVAATSKGAFQAPMRGEAAIYAFKVTDRKSNAPASPDLAQEQAQLATALTRNLSGLMNALAKKANITDNRYRIYQ